MKEKKKLSLATKTFIGFGLGIVIGLVFGEKATIVKPLGTIFLNMIKMIVVPMVFFSITAGERHGDHPGCPKTAGDQGSL